MLTIVVSFSSLILIGRNAMLSLDDVEDDAEDMDMVGQENES